MTNQSTKMHRALLIAFLAVALGGSVCMGSCMMKSRNPLSNGTSIGRNSNPRETPIPLLPTKENNGKRCEAKYYFGVGRSGDDEGYTQFCHELQMKLTNAAKAGDLTQMREALRFGANINLPVDDYDPPLHIAAAYGQAGAVELLLDNEASINKGDFVRGTPLIVAAGNGHTEVVKLLLERGADACFRADGGTAKEAAQKRGYEEIVKLLKAAESAKCK